MDTFNFNELSTTLIIILVFITVLFLFILFFLIREVFKLRVLISESKSGQKEDLLEFHQKIQKDQFQLQDIFQTKIDERLTKDFSKNQEVFVSLSEKLARIDEAQKKIDHLGKSVIDLQSILTDKKTRGIFGESQLNHILSNVFGEEGKLYKTQYTLSNKSIVDGILILPEPLGKLAIDSKFPLENYRKLIEAKKRNNENVIELERKFKKDLKKHIDDIASKYILKGETSDQAVMFIPAEAIFYEVHANFEDIIDYAYKKKVWLTSPTTLMATLTTIQVMVKNQEQQKYAHQIQTELIKLGKDFGLFKDRWEKLGKHLDQVTKDTKDVEIIQNKISKKFQNISDVKFE